MKTEFTFKTLLLAIAAATSVLPQMSDAKTNKVIHIKEIERQAVEMDNGKVDNSKLAKSVQNKVSIGKKSISRLVAPGGSMTEALVNKVPGFQAHPVGSYSGASRYQIRINGTQIGFDAVGTPEIDGIQILLDGVPLNNPTSAFHGFETNQLPISSMFSAINVVQGPGTAENHWYDSMGGTINFHTLAPTNKASLSINLGGGSFDSYSASTEIQTGSLAGWKTLLSAGYTRTSGIRTGPTAIGPTQASAFLLKTSKSFNSSKFTAGLYVAHAQEHRAHDLPVYPISGVTTNGYQVPGPLLSEQTTGQYYTPSTDLWSKQQNYVTDVFYLRLINKLSSISQLNETIWYRHGDRNKIAINNYNTTNTSGPNVFNFDPTSNNFGAKVVLSLKLPLNVIKFGGYYQITHTHSQLLGYNSFQNPSINPFDSQPDFYRNYTTNWSSANGFIQDAFSPVKWLNITPGINIENFNVDVTNKAGAYFNQLYPNDSTAFVSTIPGQSGHFTKVAPSVGVNTDIVNGIHAFFIWSRNFQTQTGPAYGVGASDPIVPPSQPAEINSYIGGLKGHEKNIYWQLSGFHNELSNLAVQFVQAINQIVTVEPASETINGVNFLFGYKQPIGFDAYTSDSIQHATESTLNSSGIPLINVPMTGTPTYNLGFTAGYNWFKFGTDWGIAITDRYQSATYIASNITSAPTSIKLPKSAVNLLNLTLSAKTTLFNNVVPGVKNAVFKFQAYNLLNRKYNTMGYQTAGGEYGPSSTGAILAQPGSPLAVYGSVRFLF